MRLSTSALRFGGRVRQSSSSLRAARQHLLLKLLRPATGDVLARQVDDGIRARKFLRIERLARIPLHLVLAGRAPHQSDRFVTSRNQSGGKCASYQSRSAANQYSHVHSCKRGLQLAVTHLRQNRKPTPHRGWCEEVV